MVDRHYYSVLLSENVRDLLRWIHAVTSYHGSLFIKYDLIGVSLLTCSRILDPQKITIVVSSLHEVRKSTEIIKKGNEISIFSEKT